MSKLTTAKVTSGRRLGAIGLALLGGLAPALAAAQPAVAPQAVPGEGEGRAGTAAERGGEQGGGQGGGQGTAGPGAPQAPVAYTLEAGALHATSAKGRVVVPLPGPALALQVVDGRAFVALGELGAAVVGTDAQGAVVVEKLVPVAYGAVNGFLVQADGVWMQVSSTSAIRLGGASGAAASGGWAPVGALPAQAPATPAPSASVSAVLPPPAAPAPAVALLKVFDGKVLLDGGKGAGVRVGDRFKVVRPEFGSDEGGAFEADREVAVLVVESVSEDTARARIWRGDSVALGDRVEPADKNTDPSLIYPRAQHDFVEAEIHLRPILNIGDTGFGALLDGNLTYYGESFFVGLRSQPLGVGRTQGSTAFTQTLLAEGGYSSRPFAIGLGLGFTSAYGDLKGMFELTSFGAADSAAPPTEWDPTQPETTEWKQELQHTLAVEQRVRLGARDGLNLTVSNTLLYFDGADATAEDDASNAGFIWGGTEAKLTVPLALNADLFFEGGGGVMGYAYGAVGVFGWLSGNGGPGSLGLLASAGGAGVWGVRTRENLRYNYTEDDDTIVAGPMVSIGLRYRFGVGAP